MSTILIAGSVQEQKRETTHAWGVGEMQGARGAQGREGHLEGSGAGELDKVVQKGAVWVSCGT